MTITDKQAMRDRIDARFRSGNSVPVERAHITADEWTVLRAALEAAEAARGRDTPVAWVEVKDTHRGPYEFHGIDLLPEGRHELFLADQSTLREVTPAAPSSAEQPLDEQEELAHLRSTLNQIYELSHHASTGPAVPDTLWEIRQLAVEWSVL